MKPRHLNMSPLKGTGKEGTAKCKEEVGGAWLEEERIGYEEVVSELLWKESACKLFFFLQKLFKAKTLLN